MKHSLKEKFQHFFRTIKQHLNKEDIAAFFKKNWRYFSAVALFVVLVVLMVKFSSAGDKDGEKLDTEQAVELKNFEVDAVSELNELITQYYAACAAGDTAAVQAIAIPISDSELSHITMMSQYVESYQNIVCYTKPGLEEGSYLTSVSVDVKFADIDTAAPGLEFFYVRTNEEGALYIDNAYSSYNWMHNELETDGAVLELIQRFETQKDVVDLQEEVQARYEAALAADSDLMNLATVTLADAYNQWAMSVANNDGAQDQPQDTEVPSTEEPETPETPDTPEEPQQPENGVTAMETQTMYATNTVNIRQQPNESAEILGKLEGGSTITVNGSTADGWSQVDYNGTVGYVKSEYLSSEAQSAQEPADVSGPAPGSTVNLTNTINIRSSMSETASKVGVAYAGDSVTVEMNYAEGWSKVTWNNKTGYAKTEFIK